MNIQLQTTFTFFFNHKPSCAHPPQQQHTLHTHVAVSTCTVYSNIHADGVRFRHKQTLREAVWTAEARMAHFLLLLPNECHKEREASIFQRSRQAGCDISL